ncbi:hypothetical protein NQ317_002755, partial [Molorchus minor]
MDLSILAVVDFYTCFMKRKDGKITVNSMLVGENVMWKNILGLSSVLNVQDSIILQKIVKMILLVLNVLEIIKLKNQPIRSNISTNCNKKNEIVYFNCQGFINNKDQILQLVLDWKPIILCLSETHVDDDITDSELKIAGYNYEKCVTTNRRTGGILIYISDNYKYKVKETQNLLNYLWLISITIKLNKCNYIISALYHPPQVSDNLFIEFFKNYLDSAVEFNGTLIICGDFNYDLLSETYYGNKCKTIINQNGLSQLIKGPTRVTLNSATLIDYVITNNRNLISKVHYTPKISDHAILTIKISVENANQIQKMYKRSYKNYNLDTFHSLLQETVWNTDVSDIDKMATSFTCNIKTILDNMCPIQEVTLPEKYINNKWMTNEILSKMKERDILYQRAIYTKNENDWNKFKILRNHITQEIKRQKEKYFNDIIDENKNNSRVMWKNLKVLLPNNKKTSGKTVKFDDIEYSNEQTISENFNQYFILSIHDIINEINKYHDHNDILTNVERHRTLSSFKLIDMSKLKTIVKSLKNTSDLEDGISTKILKDAVLVIGNRLLDVINTSLQNGVFPSNWKQSIVVPAPKVSNTTLCEEFRPINTVPPYEKILEIVVKDEIVSYCEENSVIVPNQSGFRDKHSCETVILHICDTWLKANDNGEIVLAVFLDFRRAFETVDRNMLIKKLEKIGICGIIIDENLCFKSHANYIMNKMSKKVYFMSRVGKCLSMFTKITIYKSIIAPHIDFCSSVLFNLKDNQIQQLQKIQNRGMRNILQCNKFTPIKLMLE